MAFPGDADRAVSSTSERAVSGKVKSLFFVYQLGCFELQVTDHPTNSGIHVKHIGLLTKKSLGR